MKIVVTDPSIMNLGDITWEPLHAYGELTVYDKKEQLPDHQSIIDAVGDAEIAVIHQSAVTKQLLDACTNIKYISLTSVGFDMVQPGMLEYAKEKGIMISNLAGYGPATIAQHALALLLELTNHVGEYRKDVAAGLWRSAKDIAGTHNRLSMMELEGKTLGVIGYGKIGSRLAQYAKVMGMNVVAYSPYSDEAAKAETEHVSLEYLLSVADVISLHCPLTDETCGIISADVIAKMKDGVLLVNSARGGLIDEQALADALKSGKVRGAAVDVVSVEPIREDNPLRNIENCIITPHSAWVSMETRQRMVSCIGDNINGFLTGKPICVINA